MAVETLPTKPQVEYFIRPKFNVTKTTTADEGCLQTLPDIVEFNAAYNRDHLFCAQYGHDIHAPPHFITHGDLYQAVLRFSAWLTLQDLAQRPQVVDGKVVKSRPIAMLMSSDVTWFITFLALLRVGVPVRDDRVQEQLNPDILTLFRYCACPRACLHKPLCI